MTLLEREPHLRQLHESLRRVADGGGEMVFLSGEGGIGKTSLIERFLSEVPGSVGSAVVSCDGLGVPGPFGALFDIADALGPEVAALLAEQAPREQIFRSVLGAFRAAPGTMVMVGEDAHWTDEATLELIRFLGRRIRSTRALFIVSYRDDQLGPYHPLRRVLGDLANAPGVHRMELPPLSRETVGAMVAGTGINADEVYALTEGNPFLLTEIIESGTTGVPATVMDAVLSRVSRLSPEGRAVLDAAATIGVTVDPVVLATVIGGPIADTVEECLAVGILRPHGSMLEFRHGISRYAILDSMSSPRRRALHGRVLDVMERGPVDERDLGHLAYHAEEAGDAVAARDYAVRAARWAAAFGSHREAAGQYERAMRFLDRAPVDQRLPVLEAFAHECYLTGRMEDAVRLEQDAIAASRAMGDRLREGAGLRWLSRYKWFSGQTRDAFRAAKASRVLLEQLPPGPELAMAWSNLSLLFMSSWDLDGAMYWGERAMALADALGSTPIRIHVMSNIGTAQYAAGDEHGLRVLDDVARMGRDHGRDDDVNRALTNAALIAWLRQDLGVAERKLSEAIEWASARDLVAMELFQRSLQAAIAVNRGAWAAGRAQAENIALLPEAIVPTRIMALATLGRVQALMGEDPWQTLDEARELAAGTGEMQRLLPTTLARAEAAWLDGDLPRVLADVTELAAHPVARRHGWIGWQLGLWQHRAGLPVDTSGFPERIAREIAGAGAEAGDLWDAIGYPLEAARATASTGRVDDLRAALEAFEKLGAIADAARVARQLRAMGERHIPRGPRKATRQNVANLTERELEVLALLVEGATNREIAERLYMSVKTAGHHVSAILGKLDVESRRDAVVRARGLGLAQGRESTPEK